MKWNKLFVVTALILLIGMAVEIVDRITRPKIQPVNLGQSGQVGIQETEAELVIKYTEGGKNFQLVFEPKSGQVIIRLPIIAGKDNTEETLDLLVKEVVRLVSPRGAVKLGGSGMTFYFKRGYPVWSPFGLFGPGDDFKCLYFAQEALVSSGFIEAEGIQESEIPSYYPYPKEVKNL